MTPIADKWHEAETNLDTPVDLGRLVICDVCSADMTDSPDTGGFIFGSYGYCPKCATCALPEIKGYGELHFITAMCPPGVSFADFVRAYRAEHGNSIVIREIA